jgi:hypothetical protein
VYYHSSQTSKAGTGCLTSTDNIGLLHKLTKTMDSRLEQITTITSGKNGQHQGQLGQLFVGAETAETGSEELGGRFKDEDVRLSAILTKLAPLLNDTSDKRQLKFEQAESFELELSEGLKPLALHPSALSYEMDGQRPDFKVLTVQSPEGTLSLSYNPTMTMCSEIVWYANEPEGDEETVKVTYFDLGELTAAEVRTFTQVNTMLEKLIA